MNLHQYSGTWGRPQLLLVDDEEAVLKAVPRALRTAVPEWRVHVAQNASAALQILRDNTIDVLVTDLGMPGMNGLELMAVVQRSFPNVARVAHSADLAALNSGATRQYAEYLMAKPVSPEHFTAVLDEALAKRRLAVGIDQA